MVCIKEVRQGKGQFLGKDDSHLQELSIYDLGIKNCWIANIYPAELGTRLHCRDNVTKFLGHNIVDYCILSLWLLHLDTETLKNIFIFFLSLKFHYVVALSLSRKFRGCFLMSTPWSDSCCTAAPLPTSEKLLAGNLQTIQSLHEAKENQEYLQ